MATDKEKQENFKKVGGKRMAKALKAIEMVANCANKGSYEYTPAQVNKLVADLENQVAYVKECYKTGKTAKAAAEYTL